jgi:hypothetical protein
LTGIESEQIDLVMFTEEACTMPTDTSLIEQRQILYMTKPDEGMPNRPSIFVYLVFGLGGVSVEEIARPMKIAAWRDPGATLGVQAKIRRVQV